MADPNFLSPEEWDLDIPEAGLKALRLGPRVGLGALAAIAYELAPGGAVSPYHLHLANEELLFVLDGRPSIRTPDGVRELEPGAVVGFPTGEEGAHRVFNASEAPARVLMVSTNRFPEVAHHLDTGTWLTLHEDGTGNLFPPGDEGDVMEWMRKGMAAGAQEDGSA
jgi:uncharacterized cupin superfamily protein